VGVVIVVLRMETCRIQTGDQLLFERRMAPAHVDHGLWASAAVHRNGNLHVLNQGDAFGRVELRAGDVKDVVVIALEPFEAVER